MNTTRAQIVFGYAFGLFGFVLMCIGVYLLATGTLVPGDINGTMTRAVLIGLGGLLSALYGAALATEKPKDGNSNKNS